MQPIESNRERTYRFHRGVIVFAAVMTVLMTSIWIAGLLSIAPGLGGTLLLLGWALFSFLFGCSLILNSMYKRIVINSHWIELSAPWSLRRIEIPDIVAVDYSKAKVGGDYFTIKSERTTIGIEAHLIDESGRETVTEMLESVLPDEFHDGLRAYKKRYRLGEKTKQRFRE